MKTLFGAVAILLVISWTDTHGAFAASRAGTSAVESGVRDARDAVQRQQQDEVKTAPVTRKLKTRHRHNYEAGR